MTGGAVVRVALAGVAGWLTLAVVVFPPTATRNTKIKPQPRSFC